MKNKVVKAVPFVVMVILIILFLFNFKDLSIETILEYSPDNLILAALFLICLFGLKSYIIVFPIIILYGATAVLFPVGFAIIVNILGTIVCLLVPYMIGRFSGGDFLNTLIKKYPRIGQIHSLQQTNPWFFAYITRVVILLPCDVISLYLGASKMQLGPYLTGSVIGMLPGMIAVTLFGASIMSPGSSYFIVAVFFMTVLIGTSFWGYFKYLKPKNS